MLQPNIGPRDRDTRGRVARMRELRDELVTRQTEAWEWMEKNASSNEFVDRAREANLLAGRIEVLNDRMNNLNTGLPEMGTRLDTITPLTKTPFT